MSEYPLTRNSLLVDNFAKFLGCPCTYFEPTLDDTQLLETYKTEWELANSTQDFCPVFVVLSEQLLSMLSANSDDYNMSGHFFYSNEERVLGFRNNCLQDEALHGADILDDLVSMTREVFDDPLWIEHMQQQQGGSVDILESFVSWWDYSTGKTYPMILAKIPVKMAHQIFAYLPIGGWGDCPCNQALLAIARYWSERYKAVPAIIGANSVEFKVNKVIAPDEAMGLAIKHYAFCPAIIESSKNVTLSSYAQSLIKSKVWLFWWS